TGRPGRAARPRPALEDNRKPHFWTPASAGVLLPHAPSLQPWGPRGLAFRGGRGRRPGRAGSCGGHVAAEGERDRVRAVGRAELAHGGLRMLVDGAFGDLQDLPDLPGGLASRHPAENLALARRERSASRPGLGNLDELPFAAPERERLLVRPRH